MEIWIISCFLSYELNIYVYDAGIEDGASFF